MRRISARVDTIKKVLYHGEVCIAVYQSNGAIYFKRYNEGDDWSDLRKCGSLNPKRADVLLKEICTLYTRGGE